MPTAQALAQDGDVAASTPKPAVSAVEMGARQREISVSEFFTKNRHLLGFDNPRKALLTCVKEAVDNALDACEEAGHPARRRRQGRGRVEQWGAAAPGEPGDALPRHRHRQRPRHRPAADPADLREAPLRLEVPPPAHEPRPAGHRHLRRRHVRAAHHRQARPDHLAHRREAPAHYFEVQIDTKKNEPQILEKKQIDWEQPRGTQVTLEVEGRYQKGRASVDEYVEQIDHREPARQAHLPHAGGRDEGVPADDPGAAAVAARDQAASLRHRARHAAQDAPGHEEPLALRLPGRRLQPGLAAPGRGDLQGRELSPTRAPRTSTARTPRRSTRRSSRPRSWRRRPTASRPSARRRSSPASTSRSRATSTRRSAGRRRCTAATPSSSRRAWPSARGRSRRPEAAEEAVPLAEGEEREDDARARARHPLREPRAAALPAVGVRDLQGRARHRLAQLRPHPVPRRARRPGRW